MTTFVVGEPFPIELPEHDGARYAYQEGFHSLAIFLTGPTPREVRAVESGAVRFSLTPIHAMPSLLFLLFTFPGAMRWSDAPYHVQLEPEAVRPTLDTLTADNVRLGISIVLVDRADGIVCALRFVSYSPQFSRALNGIIRQQLEEPFDRAGYDAALARAYQQYPKPQDMLGKRVAHCEGGA